MKKLLVTGASGFLGWNVFKEQAPDWHLTGTWNQHRDGLMPRSDHYQLNLLERDEIWRCLKELNPDAVLHLAACADTNYCEENPEETWALNVDATATLAEMCAERRVHLIFTSSEQVFDGTKEQYSEEDEPNPQNEYGKQKLEAEKLVRAIYPEAAIVRISVLYGMASSARPGFLQKWLDAWQHFVPVKAFYDEFRSFLGGASAARGLFHLLGQQASGTIHIGGEEGLSRFDLALLVRERFKLEHAPVEICSQKDVKMAAYRPPRLVLDHSLLASTGFRPMPLEEELNELVEAYRLPPPFSEN